MAAVVAQVAALLAGEAPGGGQAHASASACAPPGEKGTKKMLARQRAWSRPRVLDHQHQALLVRLFDTHAGPTAHRCRLDRVPQQGRRGCTRLIRIDLNLSG